ncbi:hypothetical protein ACOME3_000703 [Neoechinorhynchus agilis]
MSSDSRYQLYFKARLAEEVDRYTDMSMFMKKLTQLVGVDLTADERNALSTSYKSVASRLRSAWRLLTSVVNTEDLKLDSMGKVSESCPYKQVQIQSAKEYRDTIESELKDVCLEALSLIDSHLLKNATSTESQVFYAKMKGDYYRYLAEISAKSDAKRDEYTYEASIAYEEAIKHSENELEVTHPIRLGLALNYSVFLYEVKNDMDKACDLASKTYMEAIKSLDDLSDEYYKDSSLLIDLLQENLTLWKSRQKRDAESEDRYGIPINENGSPCNWKRIGSSPQENEISQHVNVLIENNNNEDKILDIN